MIDGDLRLALTLVQGHKKVSDERRGLWKDIASKYRGMRLSDPDHPDMKDPVENGALFGVFDTKVAATTPQRPRGAFTPTRRAEPFLSQARNREALVGHTFRERRLHMTLRKLNVMARAVPHVFLKASWDWRVRMPRWEVLTPLECWFDESPSDPLDIAYYIRRRWLRKHEVMDLIKGGLYPRDFLTACNPARRDLNSRLLDAYGPDDILKTYEVYELHDLHEDRVYHFSENWPGEWLLEQEGPEHLFVQRGGFFCLSFNEYLDGQRGLSDGEIGRGPAERLSRLDNIEYRHVKTSVPDIVLNTEAFTDPERAEEELTRPRQPGQILRLGIRQGYTVAQALGSTPTPPLPPNFATARSAAGDDLAYRMGMPPYTRGQEGSKVATELALQQQAEATRRAWDVDMMQDAVTFCAKSCMGLYEEHLEPDEVIHAGTDDGAGRLSGVVEVFRDSLGFRDPATYAYELATGQPHAMAVDFFFTPEAFEDPMTGNPTSRIATLQSLFAASNVVNPASPIDGRHVADAMRRELHETEDFLVPQQQPGAAPPGAPAAPGGAPAPIAPAAPTDTTSGGGLPPNLAAPAIPPGGPMVGGAGVLSPVPKGAGILP